MSKRAGNLEKPTAWDRAYAKAQAVDQFLIEEGELCPFCRDLACSGRGEKTDCMEWPAYAAKHGIKVSLDNTENSV